ncbi:MAG TPA: hypothetical protein VNX01_14355 [Bacteroidia bacterium]|jgi:hypothetical protein|nr:hypothetical protein [Bacteroidia bacterium]
MKRLFLFITLTLLLLFQSCNGIKSKSIILPWHLVDIWYKIEKPQSFESLSIDFEILQDIPSNCELYIAPLGLGKLNDISFYGGVQTNTGGYEDKNHVLNNSPKFSIGRSVIFSRWKETNPDAIIIAKGGVCEVGDYEGDFISVRNNYQWNKGKYKITLFNTHKKETINKKPHTFVGMKIVSYVDNTNQVAGYLAFPGDEIKLGESLAIFVELYGNPISITQVPKCKIQCSNITINEIVQTPKTISAYYPKKFPQMARTTWDQEKVIIEIGESFNRDNYNETEKNYYNKIK